MGTPKSALTDVQDWDVVRQHLPDGWQDAAKEFGALTRSRGVEGPESLLRVLLIHLACGCSLKETAVRARDAGLAAMNHAAIARRLRSASDWLRWLAEETRITASSPARVLGRRLVAVDATVITEPGSTGTDYRVHYALNLADLQCTYFKLTDVSGGETFRLFPIQSGDVMMGDRVYATAKGVTHVLDHGGDVLVRLNRSTLQLFNAGGHRLNPLRLARKSRVGVAIEHPAHVRHPDTKELQPGRLIVTRRTREATQLARKKLKQKASRTQTEVSEESWKAAAYFWVFTTLPESVSSETVLDLYRERWQIELAFKRLKSIMSVGHLPKKNPESAVAWLHGKLLVAFLVERIIAAAAAFSPWGCTVEQPAEPVA